MEGKEVRFGPAASGLWAASTTGTSNGSVNSMHDSFTPLGGMASPLSHMMLGEVSPGGVGVGLNGMLIMAILSVFIAGLMVGRTPEYLGKKIQAAEMKLVVLYVLAMPLALLGFAAASVLRRLGARRRSNPGPHGLREILYAFTSAVEQQRLGLRRAHRQRRSGTTRRSASPCCRPVLPDHPGARRSPARWPASSRRRRPPARSRRTRRCSAAWSSASSLIVAGLTFFPALALGPIVEHLSL